MECAGNGRALLEPRPISQPWLTEAVGTARWRGVPLGTLLEEAAPPPDAVDVVFAGLDRGVEGDVEQRYERSLPIGEALEAGAVLAYEMNGAPLPPQHGFPLRLVVPGLVRDDERQVAVRDHRARRSRSPATRWRPGTGSGRPRKRRVARSRGCARAR